MQYTLGGEGTGAKTTTRVPRARRAQAVRRRRTARATGVFFLLLLRGPVLFYATRLGCEVAYLRVAKPTAFLSKENAV